ncbi:MAG: DUF2147 domain-containing protein [Holosporales bacterium]
MSLSFAKTIPAFVSIALLSASSLCAVESPSTPMDNNTSSSADAGQEVLAMGKWLTEDGRAHVDIHPCTDKQEALCGKIVWLKEPIDTDTNAEKLDKNNPDEKLRDRKLLGLEILSHFVKSDEPNTWKDGKIYSPREGSTYSCTMTLKDNEKLEVHGYVALPLFGKTQVWTRVKD